MPCLEDCADNAAGDFDHVHPPVGAAVNVTTPTGTLSERISRATLTRKGITYSECLQAGCRYVHLVIDGRAYAEWTHPRVTVSPFVQRALAGTLPAKITR